MNSIKQLLMSTCLGLILVLGLTFVSVNTSYAIENEQEIIAKQYLVGVDDVLDIVVLRPEEIANTVTVAPDGTISFPYIGNIKVSDMSLNDIQADIQERLSNGFMKYPVLTVTLRESRSKKFFVYGEVMRPGPYPMEDNTTVLRAISTSGGFTKFGSSSRVKVLRPNKNGVGYQTVKVDIKQVMDGDSSADVLLEPGDIVVVSEGIF
ncbi:MAG: polysaccharide export protein [Candidatus Omnitrophica bacterium]|nr:polysaccharide export protein [Candidatus Omnitrophota bacterium]